MTGSTQSRLFQLQLQMKNGLDSTPPNQRMLQQAASQLFD
jgi:hypothetical protein